LLLLIARSRTPAAAAQWAYSCGYQHVGAERVKLAAPSDRAEQANLLLRLRLVVLRRMIRDGRLHPIS